jgi:hypothetical protein
MIHAPVLKQVFYDSCSGSESEVATGIAIQNAFL